MLGYILDVYSTTRWRSLVKLMFRLVETSRLHLDRFSHLGGHKTIWVFMVFICNPQLWHCQTSLCICVSFSSYINQWPAEFHLSLAAWFDITYHLLWLSLYIYQNVDSIHRWDCARRAYVTLLFPLERDTLLWRRGRNASVLEVLTVGEGEKKKRERGTILLAVLSNRGRLAYSSAFDGICF